MSRFRSRLYSSGWNRCRFSAWTWSRVSPLTLSSSRAAAWSQHLRHVIVPLTVTSCNQREFNPNGTSLGSTKWDFKSVYLQYRPQAVVTEIGWNMYCPGLVDRCCSHSEFTESQLFPHGSSLLHCHSWTSALGSHPTDTDSCLVLICVKSDKTAGRLWDVSNVIAYLCWL